MKNSIKLGVSAMAMGVLLTGCEIAPKPDPGPVVEFGEIRYCSLDLFNPDLIMDRTLAISCEDERAEVGTFDAGSSSNIPPTQHVTVSGSKTSFHFYDLHGQDKVVYSVENQNSENLSFDLWVSDGRTGKIRLTNTDYLHMYPSFSNDGNSVYFISNRGQPFANNSSYMWRMAANGSGGLTRIGRGAYFYTQAVHESPNGQYILYSSVDRPGAQPTVWYARKNGTVPTQLTVGKSAIWLNNDTIVYEVEDRNTGLSSIWRMRLDGSEKTLIIAETDSDVIHIVPSPDRTKMAYVTQGRLSNGVSDTSSRDVWIVDLATGAPTQITTNKSQDAFPRWSSDGRTLFFASSRGINWNLWKMNVAGIFGAPDSNFRNEIQPVQNGDESPWAPGAFEVDDGFE